MNSSKEKIWIERIKDYKSSGLTASKWCEDNNIPIHKLRYQITKSNKENKEESKNTKWATATVAKSIDNKEIVKPLKVIIGHSTIEVAPGFDSNTFQTVVKILSTLC